MIGGMIELLLLHPGRNKKRGSTALMNDDDDDDDDDAFDIVCLFECSFAI
jgi:hypothetical protein